MSELAESGTVHADAPDILLRVESLTKRFPQVLANDSVSFDVRRAEVHCLLGENGAGKSTLAECLYGFYRPDSGQIFFKGQPVTISSPVDAKQLGIGMVHQHFALVRPLTVVENVVVGTADAHPLLDLAGPEKKLSELCRTYGVKLDLSARVQHLSVGEQQWVEILKALYSGVELLILDEPTAVLTPQETERLLDVLDKMRGAGISIILITHKLWEVMRIADRITVLRKGTKVTTVDKNTVDEATLARMMVGRERPLLCRQAADGPGRAVAGCRPSQCPHRPGTTRARGRVANAPSQRNPRHCRRHGQRTARIVRDAHRGAQGLIRQNQLLRPGDHKP